MLVRQIGPHRVHCGNIMDGIDQLMAGDRADFVYSDPPWGQGNLKYWQTINKRHTGAEPIAIDYGEFLERYFDIVAKYAKDRVVIEYGMKWREDIVRVATSKGFVHGGTTSTWYGSAEKPLECDVLLFSKSGDLQMTDAVVDLCRDHKGQAVSMGMFKLCAPKGGIALDPMCGMGYTASAAMAHGMVFRGNELNRKRLEKTIQRLKRGK